MSNIAWSFDERRPAYASLAKLGFQGVEVAPGLLFADCDDAFAPAKHIIKERRNELNEHGLEFCSMQSLLFGKADCALFETKLKRDNMRDGLKTAIDLASDLDIPNIVFGSPKARNILEGLSTEEASDIAARFFIDLADFAKDRGVAIALEANPKVYGTNFLNHFSETVDLANALDHPAIKVNLDVGSFLLNKDEVNLTSAFKDAYAVVNHIHISEPFLAPAPDEGTVPALTEFLDIVQSSEYDKFVSIEMRRHDTGLSNVESRAKLLVGMVPNG